LPSLRASAADQRIARRVCGSKKGESAGGDRDLYFIAAGEASVGVESCNHGRGTGLSARDVRVKRERPLELDLDELLRPEELGEADPAA
jgi:hypothetical protein